MLVYLVGGQLGRGLLHLIDVTRHVEGCLGQVIELTGQNLLETTDGILELHETTGTAREDLGDVERLRHEALSLAGTRDSQLVIL